MIPGRLLVVTDRHGSDRPLADTVRAALDGGARWIWFRDKDMARDARRALAAELQSLVHAAGGILTIGADAALAAEIGADGVHLGMASLAPEAPNARNDGGGGLDRLTGASAHGLPDIRAAAVAGADYVTLSPIFLTQSKPGYGPALGLDGLRATAGIGLPVVALGGVTHENAAACREAGAAGVAVMGGIMRARDPAAATRTLLAALRAT